MTTKDEILNRIRLEAAKNGEIPLGQKKFATVTGIPPHAWRMKYWARWNEAVAEAGFAPNSWATRVHGDEVLVLKLADLALELGHYPTEGERGMKHRSDAAFPWPKTFRERLGDKQQQVRLLMEFATSNPSHRAVFEMCTPLETATVEDGVPRSVNASVPHRVYLAYSHSLKLFKIGETDDVNRRLREIRSDVPGPIDEVHVLETDDPAGIEQYWHRRFRERKRINEWFDLTPGDVEAFKSRGSSM